MKQVSHHFFVSIPFNHFVPDIDKEIKKQFNIAMKHDGWRKLGDQISIRFSIRNRVWGQVRNITTSLEQLIYN